jgi:CubicO group peptidase (beta-lactamase class C family)
MYQSVDQKVLEFFPEYVHGANDIRKRNITIKHLLTMTAPFPFAWKEGDRRGHEPLDRLRRQRDWVTYILNLMGQNGQPGRFQYYTAGAHLLSAIISRTTGMCAREFANARLFHPTGMLEIPDHEMKSWGLDDVFGKNLKGWIKDPQGYTVGGLGLTLTPRDMARFGFLYLNRGFWDGKQVVSEMWIDESTDVSTALDPKEKGYNGYGYLWWLKEAGNTLAYLALGDGGNVICCIPKKDITVVIASHYISNFRDRWPLFEECIIPAIID